MDKALEESELAMLKLPVDELRRLARTSGKLYEAESRDTFQGAKQLTPAATTTTGATAGVTTDEAATAAVQTPRPVAVDGSSKEEISAALDSYMERLQGLKRKLQQSQQQEEKHSARVKARLKYLSMYNSKVDREAVQEWRRFRMNRVLVDHLLREGFHGTACQLAKAADIEELVEIDLFAEALTVMQSLQEGQCKSALEWCDSHRSKLKKLKSKLEFQLRLQQFLEKVREGQWLDAIAFARKYLAEWAGSELEELQSAMATLAFRDTSKISARYSKLFDKSRYDHLIELFKKDFCLANGLTVESLLTLHLRVGLSVLKMPSISETSNRRSVAWEESEDYLDDDDEEEDEANEDRMDTETRDDMLVDNKPQTTSAPSSNRSMPSTSLRSTFGDRTRDDPFCQDVVSELAASLPTAKRIHSKLICPVTQKIMNESNPPMVLPNGYVYSQEALEHLTRANPGLITCPVTHTTCKPCEVVKAYIM